MNKHQPTVYGVKTLIELLLGKNPVSDQFSTVNERLTILPDARPTVSEKVRLAVLTAGNGGHSAQPGTGGIPLIGTVDHTATDASLYNILPMAVRAIDEDLTAIQRQRYCLRKIININGINYYAYYGLRIQINPEQTNVQMVKITRTESGVVETPFVPNNDNLYPTPPNLPDMGAITASDVSVKVSALVKVVLTRADIAEFVEAIKILHNGDERYAVMSEFGLCTAADRIVDVEGTSGTFQFNESIGTTTYAYAMEHKALFYNTQELTIDFDLGNQMPLFAPQSIPTMTVV